MYDHQFTKTFSCPLLPRCHDKMGIPICGACRRPIEERVVTALGKNWYGSLCSSLLSFTLLNFP